MHPSISIKIPTPRKKVAKGWGEYHFAVSLKNSLIQLGHPTSIDFFNAWKDADAACAEVNIVIRGARVFEPVKDAINILWVISHPSSVSDEEIAKYDWLFVASEKFTGELVSRGIENVSFLPQATDHTRFFPGQTEPDKSHDVLFVGNRRKGRVRKVVKLALEAGTDVSVYGGKWDGLVPDENIAGKTIANEDLGRYYRSAGAVLNDHWPDMAERGFVSNRVYDVLASGRPLITDRVEAFPENLAPYVYFYDDQISFAACVDKALAETGQQKEKRHEIAKCVMSDHSFKARADEISAKISQINAQRATPADQVSHSFCVVTCIKNEGPFILEWIAHNLALGVTDFLILTNDCDDGSDELLDRLDELGIVRHLPNPSKIIKGVSHHGTCLRYAPYHREFKRSDYIVIIDVDEFITISLGDGTLNDLINHNGAPDIISISELIFGFGGIETFADKPVLEQFVHSNDLHPGNRRARRGVKSIIRNSKKIRKFTNHRPAIVSHNADDIRWLDGSGRPVEPDFMNKDDRGFNCRGCYDHAILNHFSLRSGESMLAKLARGDAVRQDRLDSQYFHRRNSNKIKVEHTAASLPAMTEQLTKLLEDDSLRRIHEKTVVLHRAKIEALKKDPKMAGVWDEIQSVVRNSDPQNQAGPVNPKGPVSLANPQKNPGRRELPKISSLWIGGRLSWLEQLCLKSFADAGHHTTLYSYSPIPNIPQGVHAADAEAIFPSEPMLRHARTGSPAIHADIWRLHLLQKTDEIWVDADMYCYRPFDFNSKFVFGWEKPDLVCNAVLGLPGDSDTLGQLLHFLADEYAIAPWLKPWQIRELQEDADAGNPVHITQQNWGFTGPAAVTHFLNATGEIKYAQPVEAFYPISFKDRNHMIHRRHRIEDRLSPETRGVHFWARRMKPRLEEKENNIPMEGSFMHGLLARHEIEPAKAPIPAKVKQDNAPTHDPEFRKAIVSAIREDKMSMDRVCRKYNVEKSVVKECLAEII